MNEMLAERSAALSDVDWDWYEASAAGQVVYDDDVRLTIQGVPVEMRMSLGMLEENTEILCDDSPADAEAPDYQRLKALVSGRDYVDELSVDEVSAEQIRFHLNEFGDFLWFLTNYVELFDIHIGDVARDYGSAATVIDAPRAPLSSNELAVQHTYSQEFIWFRNSAHRLFEVVGRISNRENSTSEIDAAAKEELKIAAGRHLAAMSLLAEETFGVGVAEITEMNIQKIDGRRERGTVVTGNGDGR